MFVIKLLTVDCKDLFVRHISPYLSFKVLANTTYVVAITDQERTYILYTNKIMLLRVSNLIPFLRFFIVLNI